MTTEVEREMCTLCADCNKRVSVPGEKGKVKCGGAKNPHCPGFSPARTGMEGKR